MATATRRQPLQAIELMERERGVLIGGTEVGKSTLAEVLLDAFLRRYPTSRVLILDSKPRFRAEWELTGRSAARRYKHWDHGAAVPGSVVLNLHADDFGMPDAWKLGWRVAIVQSEDLNDRPRMLDALALFFAQARASRPTLAYEDELMDFFSQNGQPIPGAGRNRDAILRVSRAGRERGMSQLSAMQRPVGIPVPIVQETTKWYLFELDNREDWRRVSELGVPPDAPAPQRRRDFLFYDKRTRQAPRIFRLAL